MLKGKLYDRMEPKHGLERCTKERRIQATYQQTWACPSVATEVDVRVEVSNGYRARVKTCLAKDMKIGAIPKIL